MRYAIYIKSYRTDRFFLDYCLRSLRACAKGVTEIIVELPEGDRPHFDGFNFDRCKVVWSQEPSGDGYMWQQACKMRAYRHTDCDIITFVDSDCFALRPFQIQWFHGYNGRIVQLARRWKDVPEAHAAWFEPTRHALCQLNPMFEFMACHPMSHYRHVLEDACGFLENHTGQTVEAYIMSRQNRSFSEFNYLGAFAHLFYPYLYEITLADPTKDNFPRVLEQAWSWAPEGDPQGLNQERIERYEKLLETNSL